MTDVGHFASLFRGRNDVYGLGEGRVVRDRLTLDQYEAHLEGQGSGIGVFPLTDEDQVWFAAIDLDEPNFELAMDLQLFLPGRTWVERSRSGNAHVWAFFLRPVEAWVPRGIMKHALESVGRKDVEVFPKQDQLRPGMVGNYINLPYHGTDRPILHAAGEALPPGEFVDRALVGRIHAEDWYRRALALGIRPPSEREAASEFGERPFPHDCALHIYKHRQDNPIRAGVRSTVIFNLSRQLLNWRDLTIEEAWEMVSEVNYEGDPPLPAREARRIFETALSGRYTSTGCDDPLMADYVLPDCPIAHG